MLLVQLAHNFSMFVEFCSSQVNPSCLTKKTAGITTQISVISQPEASGKESFQKSRITAEEGNKLSAVKVCKITPAFSSLKTLRSCSELILSSFVCSLFKIMQGLRMTLVCFLRNIGANTVLATSSHQKEANSLVNSQHNKETQGITPLKNDHQTDSGDNKKLSNPFLKRKTIEV